MNAEWHKKHVLPRRDPAVDAYLAGVCPQSRSILQKLRKTIHSLVPEVEECISYRMPEDARERAWRLYPDEERSSLRSR